ncbi:MAG: hypothetical protein NHF92_01025 [Candidatus Shikimatogenerans bostrichidophilus]|nr:MAG: hypothetical protein NHF92_01025 [Candidatus Shikimatogenerans bostrichidophilus]
MKTIKRYIPLITPLDGNLNIDYLSLEKILFHIIDLEKIDNLIIFDNYSEYKLINVNDRIDLINCIINNNNNNINLKLILKINDIYNYNDLIYEINKKLYKNIYYIILDFPFYYNKIYKEDILINYIKLFKYYKYLYFYFSIKKGCKIDENFLLKLKNKCNNFIGILNKNNYNFQNYELINNIDIIINNDLNLFNNINLNISGVSSPLFYFFLNYFYNEIFLRIQNRKYLKFNNTYYNVINFINILYKKIYTISGIKFLLHYLNICNFYIKDPIYNIDNISYYKKLKILLNKIINN